MLEQETLKQTNGNGQEPSILSERGQRLDPNLLEYLSYYKTFSRRDWIIYLSWVGIMLALGLSTLIFFLVGSSNGVNFPVYTWLIPIGILTFTFAITFDNIAHSAIYKQWIDPAEYMVHNFSTVAGVLTVFALMAGYDYPTLMRVPIYVFAFLSILYSLIDEAMHWFRYARGGSGYVEVTMHFLILVGHTTMVLAWIWWYETGYEGVAATLSALGL
jgi:hypothetical protein